jgi:S1-C subfamily serine protease
VARRIQRALEIDQASGVRVMEVRPHSPAMIAGVEEGDLIVGIDGTAITGIDALQRLLDSSRIGRLCVLRVIRRGRLLHLTLTPRERD